MACLYGAAIGGGNTEKDKLIGRNELWMIKPKEYWKKFKYYLIVQTIDDEEAILLRAKELYQKYKDMLPE